jgi:hypothetical protein
MRKVFSVALMAGLLCLVGITKEAGANATISLIWGACGGVCTGVGTNSVTVNPGPGQTLRLDIFLIHNEVGGMQGHGISLNFDTDLLNELNLAAGTMVAVEWAGTDMNPSLAIELYGPAAGLGGEVESSGATAGRINNFESLTGTSLLSLPINGAVYTVGTFSALAPASYRIGQAFFTVNGAITDGDDVFSGLFNAGYDGLLNSGGGPVAIQNFLNASVNVVPEPGTVSLLGLGLVGLVLAGRRSRRS